MAAHDRVETQRADEHDVAALRRREAQESAPPDQARMLLALQQSAGNQAVSGLLSRRVKIAPSTKWATKTGADKLPAMPQRFIDEYEPHIITQVNVLAEKWRTDNIDATFSSADEFYRLLFNHVVRRGTAPQAPSNAPAWTVLADAVNAPGQLTEVKWSNLKKEEATKLLTELETCPVQVADNGKSSAFHSNAHGKLPKRVGGPQGELVSELPYGKQANYTPYIEFLIAGHKQENGIERGILDREAGLIYVTAHYDVGSIAWLSGAPGSLITNWSEKAKKYTRFMRKNGEMHEPPPR